MPIKGHTHDLFFYKVIDLDKLLPLHKESQKVIFHHKT